MRWFAGGLTVAALLCASCFDDPEIVDAGTGTTAGSTSTGGTSLTTTTSGTTESTGTTTSGTTAGPTTSDPSVGTTGDPPLTTGGSTGGGRTIEFDCDITDDFNRADGPVGGGWNQSTSVFAIETSRVQGTYVNDGSTFHDWVVYSGDSFGNVALSIEFQVTSFDASNEPALWARIDPTTVGGGSDFLRGYALVANSEDPPGSTMPVGRSLCLMRFDGQMEGPAATNAVWCSGIGGNGELTVGRYRLTMAVTGGGSVIELVGTLEAFDMPTDSFDEIAYVEAGDDSPESISTAGYVGFGGGEGNGAFIDNYSFDDYCQGTP